MIDATCITSNPDIIATDGDAMRRKLFNGHNKVILDRDVKTELEKLPLFDLHIIDGKCALYYDDKHNVKRLRGVNKPDKRGCMLGKNIISKSQLEYLFNASDIQNYKEILNPNNLQNVPAILRLVDKLKTCADNIESSRDQVCEELMESIKILIHIFDGILCAFSSPTICLIEQLQILSTLSHILYHQYRHYGTKFIPGQRYHDLQRMVQASFFACVLLKRKGGGKLYLYQLGTDQEEKLFSSVRTITHARNCDALELGQMLLHAETIKKNRFQARNME